MQRTGMQLLLRASVALPVLLACQSRGSTPTSQSRETKPSSRDSSVEVDLSAEIRRAEQRAAERDAERTCEPRTVVYEGSIAVNASDYVHPVERGVDFVDEPIEGLDRIVSKSPRVEFVLDYPFEKPFRGVITCEITLRRTIDSIRAGFRTMYEGTTQRDIPGMHNKDVTGPYGQAFHVIDDLVIEGIDLCGDAVFSISIGS